MLRASLSRYAQRLGGMVSALPIVFSAGAYAGSIIQINRDAGDGAATCPAVPVTTEMRAADSFSATGTLISTLNNIAPPGSDDGGDDEDNASALNGTKRIFINCTGNGLTEPHRGGVVSALRSLSPESKADERDATSHASAFTFIPAASDVANLTAMDSREGAAFDLNFIVRFRDFDDGASDKVAAMVVPLPPAFAMGLAGLAGAIVAARRVTRR